VKPLNLAEMTGLTFRYHTNPHYYLFALAGGNKVRLALHQPLEPKLRVHGLKELASADFPYDTKRYYLLKVETEGPDIRAYIDGKLILEASDSDLPKGKAGVIAGGPARFEDFHVFTPDAEAREIAENIRKRDAELIRLLKNPGIVTLFDSDGNILAQDEPIHTGCPMLPVNWRGDGQEFVLLSGNSKEGGMIDGRPRRVVLFPRTDIPIWRRT